MGGDKGLQRLHFTQTWLTDVLRDRVTSDPSGIACQLRSDIQLAYCRELSLMYYSNTLNKHLTQA